MSLKTVTRSPINDVLLSRGQSVTTDVQEYESVDVMLDEKCYIFPKIIHGLRENEEKKIRQIKGNLKKVKGKRKHWNIDMLQWSIKEIENSKKVSSKQHLDVPM